jgi:hypothetical protein
MRIHDAESRILPEDQIEFVVVLGVVALRVPEHEASAVAVVQDINVDVNDLETDALADVDVIRVNGGLQVPFVQILRVDNQVAILLQNIVTAFENPFQGIQKTRVIMPVAYLVGVLMFIVHHIEVGR